jgi:RNA polymerase sigma-70 factor, ECF subfamily
MTGSEKDLLERMLRGDQDAFTALYRRRQPAVYRFALHMTGSVTIAEDVTQETFLALLTVAKRYDAARGSVAAFLYGIARNLLLRRFRAAGDEPESEAVVEDLSGGEDLLGDLTRRETIEHVRRAVLSLPGPFREVVVLCDLGEASYEEAAAALDCPVGTVRSRLSRARAMLAQKLTVVRGTCNV